VIIAAAPVNELAPDEDGTIGPNSGHHYTQAASTIYAASRVGTEAANSYPPVDANQVSATKFNDHSH
jgi:hypothetical protein